MKKIAVILLVLVLMTGCVKVNEASMDTLIDSTINSRYNVYNHVNSGYKYYLPRDLTAVVNDEYNEIIKSKNNDYYLYVDLVAFYNKKLSVIEQDDTLYYSKIIEKDDKKGIINIKQVEDDYIIVVKYNYASVEVKCSKEYINECVTNSLIMVSSINYNEDIIKNLLNDNGLSSLEEQVTVFNNENADDDALNVEEDDIYTGNEEDDYDPDVIN